MELKLPTPQPPPTNEWPFNRTSMELKLKLWDVLDTRLAFLLIEPVWNWNLGTFEEDDSRLVTFNRTSMELKRSEVLFEAAGKDLAFNRTSMELKRTSCIKPNRRYNTFNRTSMELKHSRWVDRPRNPSFLLIEPVWNWNGCLHRGPQNNRRYF